MNRALPIWVLLAAMFGTTGLNFLFTRLYAVFAALSVRLYCRKETSALERNAKGDSVFHNSILVEMQKAGKNIMRALYIALALLLFLWLFGQRQAYDEYKNMMLSLMGIAGIACVFSEFSRITALLLLPAGITCRDNVILALKSSVFSLLRVMFFYAAGLWLYSL